MTDSPGRSSTFASGVESELAPLMSAPSPFPNARFAIEEFFNEGVREMEDLIV